MNRIGGPFETDGKVAVLRYGTPDFQVVRPGTHVLCAVTGRAIPLEELRYWSVARQEAYSDAAASFSADSDARPR